MSLMVPVERHLRALFLQSAAAQWIFDQGKGDPLAICFSH